MRTIFSTVRLPHDPALTVESLAMTATVRPPMAPTPVMTPSAGRSGSDALARRASSTRESRSRSRSRRSRAKSLLCWAFFWWYLAAPPFLIAAVFSLISRSRDIRLREIARGLSLRSCVATMDDVAELRELTAADVEQFIEQGFVIVKDCVDREVMSQWVERSWSRNGYDPRDRSTWKEGKIHMPNREFRCVSEIAPRALAAMRDLVGA